MSQSKHQVPNTPAGTKCRGSHMFTRPEPGCIHTLEVERQASMPSPRASRLFMTDHLNAAGHTDAVGSLRLQFDRLTFHRPPTPLGSDEAAGQVLQQLSPLHCPAGRKSRMGLASHWPEGSSGDVAVSHSPGPWGVPHLAYLHTSFLLTLHCTTVPTGAGQQ